MAEQMGTPSSNADASINGGKAGAPKDKTCPFCQQNFTSSSLGRHLDLYIKEKNPKPADGIHDVTEIRKMRGGITRRQPRNSAARREDSTPARTPSAQERRSPHTEPDGTRNRSPSLRMDDAGTADLVNLVPKSGGFPKASWEATGVINNIPAARGSDLAPRSWDGEDKGRREARSRSVSKQMLAKTTFEQKQKMIDALDNARAAELALREVVGSFRAAKERVEGPDVFDYDPLTLDFPALTLHCLSPPPTIYQSTPVPSSSSWSILPPDEQQYQALRTHFAAEFQRWRVSCAIVTTAPQDDLSYPPIRDTFVGESDPSEVAQRVEVQTAQLEARVFDHLHAMYSHWASLPIAKRTELWTLEFARSIGRKDDEIKKLKKERDFNQQEVEHLKLQMDEVNRLQHPREYRLMRPETMPLSREFVTEAGKLSMTQSTVGFHMTDRHEHLNTVIERSIQRWKRVVKESRGAGGLTAQKPLDDEAAEKTTPKTPKPLVTNGADVTSNDQDADADAEMDEDESFVEMIDAPVSSQKAPAAPMASTGSSGTSFRLTNGMEGLENQSVVAGYVRIGA